jgi:hypothetical protein
MVRPEACWAVRMWPVMWAEAGGTSMISTTTAAAMSTAAKGHTPGFFARLLCVQAGRIHLRGIFGVIFNSWLFLCCSLALFGGLLPLLLLGRSLLVGIAITAEREVLRTVSSEEGVIFEIGHKVKKWVWWWIEVMDRRHDIRVSVFESCRDRWGLIDL